MLLVVLANPEIQELHTMCRPKSTIKGNCYLSLCQLINLKSARNCHLKICRII
uniref:Transcription cofactor n=1 Tax=Rhizophora mucronata TaxID=61149 RepID=A0A2P2QD82_RHIMU